MYVCMYVHMHRHICTQAFLDYEITSEYNCASSESQPLSVIPCSYDGNGALDTPSGGILKGALTAAFSL